MTRWEYVGDTDRHVIKYESQWIKMSTTIVKVETTGLEKHTIASYLHSLIREPMLFSHLLFLVSYIDLWWDPIFQWLKHVYEETKVPGFLTLHMAVQYFISTTKLNDMKEN